MSVKKTTMTLNEIPKDWAICPNGKCPMADTCLRHEAYQAVAGRTDVWSSVLPEAKCTIAPFFDASTNSMSSITML